jgi:phosphoglycerate kinase
MTVSILCPHYLLSNLQEKIRMSPTTATHTPFSFKKLSDVPQWENQRVLVRVDFNVPMENTTDNTTAGVSITDDSRIQETLPTLNTLLKAGAKVILVSHLGRPKGKVDESMRLKPVVKRLQELLPNTVIHASSQVIGEETTQKAQALKSGEILVLENVRFEAGEEKNDPALSQALAALCDIYVNDAFGTAHRAHASTEGVSHYVKTAVAGLLMEKEIEVLGAALSQPAHPYLAIVGGSKVSTKITVLEQLMNQVDSLVIGGAMVFTFLKAQGKAVGKSLAEDDFLPLAQKLMDQATEKGVKLILADDIEVAEAFDAQAQHQTVSADAIPEGWMGLDVGPKTIQNIEAAIRTSKMVLWNGPLGVFEFPAFAKGTLAVAKTLAEWTEESGCLSILGGGDTVAAIEQFQIAPSRYHHVSSGGGASLEFLEGKTLPGIAILKK